MEPRRIWHPSYGLGSVSTKGSRVTATFDDGTVVTLDFDEVHKGTPASWALLLKHLSRAVFSDAAPLEWQRWLTYQDHKTHRGLVVRADGPPPPGTPRPEDTVLRPLAAAAPLPTKDSP